MILEWSAVILTLAYVWLATKEDIRCWYLGGAAAVLSIFLFVMKGLYAESFLYFIYAVLAVWGFVAWKKEGDDGPILSYGYPAHLGLIMVASILAVIVYWIFGHLPGAEKPALDASTTGFSLLATWLTIRKELHNWVYWIIIDVVTAWMYYSREMPIYAVLMLVMSIMAVYGFIQWRKDYIQQDYA